MVDVTDHATVARPLTSPGQKKGFEVHTRAAGSGADGEVVVEDYDVLVNAAGLWSKTFSEDIMHLPPTDHPCTVIQHQYVITPNLHGTSAYAGCLTPACA